MNLSKYTNAQCFAGVVGVLFLIGGIIAITAVDGGDTFSHGENVQGGDNLLMFEGNGWSSLFLLVVGALGVLAALNPATAKPFAIGTGLVLLAAAVWGIIDGEDVVNLFPVNPADKVLDLAVGLTGLAAGLTSGPGKFYRKR